MDSYEWAQESKANRLHTLGIMAAIIHAAKIQAGEVTHINSTALEACRLLDAVVESDK